MYENYDLPTDVLADVAELPPDDWPYALIAAGVSAYRVEEMCNYLCLVDDLVRCVEVDSAQAEAALEAAGLPIEAFDDDFDELSRRISKEHFELARQRAMLSQDYYDELE